MARTIVTHGTGGTARPSDVVYVHPGREKPTDVLDGLVPGMNGPFIADILSAFLAHERAGRALYRTAEERTNNPMLRSRYAEFGAETEEHIRILGDAIEAMDGDPNYVSPPARAVEGMDSKLVESTFLLAGSVDVMQQEMVLLDAVLVAESVDHANWECLAALADEMPSGEAKTALLAAVAEVEPQEDAHLQWARDMRTKMVLLQAKSEAMAIAGAKAEELVATVRSWFD